MATLTDIRTQVTAVNATGRTNLAAKGVTVAQDADTATIMGAIATIPSGGAAPTIATEITWDGDTTGLESVTVTLGDDPATFYKVSDAVLPFGYVDGTELFSYTTKESDESVHTPKAVGIDGYVVLGTFAVVSALIPNFVSEPLPFTFPSAGTWFNADNGDYYIKYIGVESVDP